MIRYFVVGSDGRPHEVEKREYQKQLHAPYLTCYTVGDGSTVKIDKITQENEHEPFPNCS